MRGVEDIVPHRGLSRYRSLSCFLQGGDELGEVLAGDAAELADLDAADLAGAEKVVDLVAADVEHLGYLLDGVGLHVISSLLAWRVVV
jgi:hypothetical protein